MRVRQIVCAAAIFLGCSAAQAAASPLIAVSSGTFLHTDRGIDTVRWRYRHRRDFYWSGRGDSVGPADTDAYGASGAVRSPNTAAPRAGSGIFRLDPPRRRGWVDPPPPR
jgi:hypothetical protein